MNDTAINGSDPNALRLEIEKLRRMNEDLVDLKIRNAAKQKVSADKIKADREKIDRLNKKIRDKENKLQHQDDLLQKMKRNDGIKPKKVNKETKYRLNKEIEEKDQQHERHSTAQSFHDVINQLKKQPRALKRGNVFIQTKESYSVTACDHLNELVKKVSAMNGFREGIWQKHHLRSDGDTVIFSFNYFGDDIMSFPGVRDLLVLLEDDSEVESFKVV